VGERRSRRAAVGELVHREPQRLSGEVAPSYIDVWGKPKKIDPQTRQALEAALGRDSPSRKRTSIPRGGKCHLPEVLEQGGKLWGFAVQLYGLRSARNWGIGDFGDLRALVEISADLGAGFVGVSPLHAASGASPYSPSSRHALNYLYIDVTAVPGYSEDLLPDVKALRDAELVDYDGARKAKLAALEVLFRKFPDKKAFEKYKGTASKGVRAYALHEVLREKLGGSWREWPRKTAAFERQNRRRIDFHLFLQWQARSQLDAVQRRALELGMPVGLYVDLALGADAGGAEVWGDPSSYALGVSIGAPPDEFNPKGQDWGLPPYSPRALRAKSYAPFVELLRANMPEGGALRMDHVMALMRLWWIPRGNPPDRGGYVSYPVQDLLAILARESRARRCLVVGEDLGTVPAPFRDALAKAGVLSYRPLIFENAFPRQAVACVTTHDLPTWKGYFAGSDLRLREKLQLSVDPEKERKQRERSAGELLDRLKGEDPHRYLARTESMMLAVQPEDALGLEEQANLPGTVDQHPNWRRKLPLPLERWASDERIASLAGSIASQRGIGARIPRATYRLQLHKGFRFADATALVPYLAELGVSHVYASPFLKARSGSLHGYDVVDHASLNPEIGSERDLDALLEALRSHGMGLVLDVVPNHMGVLHGDNAWWQDVLARGRASPYAKFFDIEWHPAKKELRDKVLLGVLGDHYGNALERGELKIQGGEARYFEHRFPLRAGTRAAKAKDPLAAHAVLERQHYRLAFWRVAADEINYRRFFEIVDLAALRQEDPDVFEATHELIARLARRPGVDGLRIDHPDGLADPEQYFRRLRERCGPRWVVGEKIVAEHESLPRDWTVHGTTGYRFANLLTGLFVDQKIEGKFDRIYHRFTQDRRSFEEISRQSRLLIMGTTLAADLNRLALRLARIAAGNRFTRDYTMNGLRRAIAEVASHFPVYRTYVTERGASDDDRRHIDWAVGRARRASRIADPSVFDFLRDVLLLDFDSLKSERRSGIVEFAMRFQQFTAPVVAKGVEDTAFYRYHRLIALNEVGGDPRTFGFSLKAFHAASEDRARHWPHTMLASSTHDTKRSEDARARLVALTELASGWRFALRRWSLLNRSYRGDVSPSDEYLYYQALVSVWDSSDRKIVERLKAYMLKAVREAKERTSWINPDTEYEAALARFIEQSLANPLFIKDVEEAMPRVARLGLLIGLSQAALKVLSPGVPDYYQGTELWDFSLVDPDNRRPVDYPRRKSFLKDLASSSPRSLLADLSDGKAKLHVIRKGLELRRKWEAVFLRPSYSPIHADGGREENIVAFSLNGKVAAVAPRLFAGLMGEGDLAPLGEKAWGGSRVVLPEGSFENVLTGQKLPGGSTRVADLLATFPVALLSQT
jgi:(1->4)-alpha-D-glucan 1-alpha-D-glucosylmutase